MSYSAKFASSFYGPFRWVTKCNILLINKYYHLILCLLIKCIVKQAAQNVPNVVL